MVRFGRCQPALHGAVNIRAGGELAKTFVDGEKGLRDLQHGGVDGAGLQCDVKHVARAQGQKRDLFRRNLVGEKNLPGENFGQGTERGNAELFAAHLLEVGDAWRGDQIEGRFVGQCKDDPNIDAIYRRRDGSSRRRAEIDAARQHRRYGLSRLDENELRLQTLFAKVTAVAGDDKRHVQDAARNIADAHRSQLG